MNKDIYIEDIPKGVSIQDYIYALKQGYKLVNKPKVFNNPLQITKTRPSIFDNPKLNNSIYGLSQNLIRYEQEMKLSQD